MNDSLAVYSSVESREFLTEVLLTYHELRPSQLEKVNELALYPNEDILWDENAVPTSNYTGTNEIAFIVLVSQPLTLVPSRRALPCTSET